MLISIVVNNYNYDDYVAASIESCLSQDYDQKEIIVVDDGSEDRSTDIIRSYGERVRSIFKSNGGQGSALNSGFFASSGEVIIFLDSDDTLHPNCLRQIAKCWQPQFSKLHFNLELVDCRGRSRGENYFTRPLPQGDLQALILTEGNYASSPTSGNAFSRSFLNNVMPIPERDWRGAADAYLFNLAPLFGEIGAIDEPLGCYRIHERNLSSHLNDQRFDIKKCATNIRREMKTEELISSFAQKRGLQFKEGALTRSYAHLQLKMIHDKLAKRSNAQSFGSPSVSFVEMSRRLNSFRGVALLKMMLIHLFMFAILLAPSFLAERLTVFGYRNGAILFVRNPKKVQSITGMGNEQLT